MNWKLIIKIQGIILLILSFSMTVPLVFSLWYGSDDKTAITAGILLTAVAGLLPVLFLKTDGELRAKEGFVIVSMGWIFAALFGALPFFFYGVFGNNYIDCFFETMSGFTTTGATVLKDIESLPQGILFWRSMTHWLGGMGIIMLTIAILPILGLSSYQLYRAEVPGPTKDRISPRIKDTAKILWLIYFGMTVLQTVLLILGGLSLFDSLCHTFGTLATGGFSTQNASIAGYGSLYIEIVIMAFMYLAGINFALHFHLVRGKIGELLSNREWQFYTAILALSVIVVSLNLYAKDIYAGFWISLRYAGFQVLSITTTTGFVSADFELWPYFSKYILVLLMFLGGCSGSTGGGIKQIRIMILFKTAYNEIKKLAHPKSFFSLKIGSYPFPETVIRNVAGFFVLFIFFFFLSTLLLSLMGYDMITAFSASIATLGNIGPGLSMVGATENYAFFDNASKLLLCFNMLLGRLEIYSVLILLYTVSGLKSSS